MTRTPTAADVVARLRAAATEVELGRLERRLPPGEPVFGVRMGTLFAIAKEASGIRSEELEQLFDAAEFEPRMAAFCILDVQARRHPGDEGRCATYLRRHDRITTWDMVDRAAPWVVGSALAGGPYDLLHGLAAAPEPLRRRTAVTAPLWFARSGTSADVTAGLAVAAVLCSDPEPVVTNAVGILLKHCGRRDPMAVEQFLAAHAGAMPAAAVRLARR
ncbi:MAG: DNA alkylation repair protein [Dermatophilaceae bacterium]